MFHIVQYCNVLFRASDKNSGQVESLDFLREQPITHTGFGQ